MTRTELSSRRVATFTSRPPTLMEAARNAIDRRELLFTLALRDLQTRYRRSMLGWAWSLINPLVTSAVYAFVFSVVLPTKPGPGDPSGLSVFAVFLLSGILPWAAMVNSVQLGIGALIGGSAMMTKVSFPREHLVLGTVLATMFSLLVELTVVTVIVLVLGVSVLPLLPFLLAYVAMLTLFASGLALFLAALNIRYRDVQHLTSVLFLVWFYLTPIVYGRSRVPEHWRVLGRELPLRDMFIANPMTVYVEGIRGVLYDGRAPSAAAMLHGLAVAVIVFLLGYRFFVRRAVRFIEDL